VYLDEHQQFFQICLPLDAVPRSREHALRRLLEPAVAAFRAAGVPAELDDDLEIVVGDAKICGHGAAQIEDAVVVVGNLIGRIERARVSDPELNGAGAAVEDRLTGVAMSEVASVLEGFGAPGRRLATAFAKAHLVV